MKQTMKMVAQKAPKLMAVQALESISMLLFLLGSFLLMGCSSPRKVEVVNRHTSDTLYRDRNRFDSIYIHETQTTEYRRAVAVGERSNDTTGYRSLSLQPTPNTCPQVHEGGHLGQTAASLPPVDTLLVERVRYEYRYKHWRDTVHIIRADTIPIVKEVEVVKEQRRFPWFGQMAQSFRIPALILLALLLFLLPLLFLRTISRALKS